MSVDQAGVYRRSAGQHNFYVVRPGVGFSRRGCALPAPPTCPHESEVVGCRKTLPDQVRDVQDPARAAVAVVEGMERLELVVDDGHTDERVDTVISAKVFLKIAEQPQDQFLANGRSVDGFFRDLVVQNRRRILIVGSITRVTQRKRLRMLVS